MSATPEAAPDQSMIEEAEEVEHDSNKKMKKQQEVVRAHCHEVKQCTEHPTKDLDIFCTKCNQTICSYCLLFGTHKSHTCLPMDVYLIECKQKILQNAKVLSDKVEVMKSSVGTIDATIQRVYQAHTQFKEELDLSIATIYQAIQSRKQKLIVKSREIRDQKIESLKKQQRVIQSYSEQLQKTSEAFESKASTLEPYETIDSMSTFEFVAHELQTKVPELWPCCNEALVKSTNVNEVVEAVKKTGEISDIDDDFKWEWLWSMVTYIALAAMIVMISMCVLGPRSKSQFIPRSNAETNSSTLLPDNSSIKCNVNDMQGVINWIGTSEGQLIDYANPIKSGKIRVRYSSLFHKKPGNDPMVFGSRGSGHVSTHNIPFSWFSFDFYPYNVHPLRYTLKNGDKINVPRNWELQASNDHMNWVILRKHHNDSSLPVNDPCATQTWHLSNPHQSFRYFRIMQTGPNSDGSHYFSLGDIELYGFVTRSDQQHNNY